MDLTRIDVTTALTVISEAGPDLSRFTRIKHFTSWLGLCPGTKISGSKVLSGKNKRTTNRAAQAFKLAAAALKSSQSALGAYYRRMCARQGQGCHRIFVFNAERGSFHFGLAGENGIN